MAIGISRVRDGNTLKLLNYRTNALETDGARRIEDIKLLRMQKPLKSINNPLGVLLSPEINVECMQSVLELAGISRISAGETPFLWIFGRRGRWAIGRRF